MGKNYFQKSYRSIEFLEDYTMEELCAAMNDIYQTKFKCRVSDDRIIVRKKMFTYDYPFNFGHLASTYINARSEIIEGESEKMQFTIGLTLWMRAIISFYAVLIPLLACMAFIYMEFEIALVLIGFIVFFVIQVGVLYHFGIKNFLKNWDHFIDGRV